MTKWRGYTVAAGSVALVTAAIGVLSSGPPRPSLSMLYLLAVLGTATAFGRGPAIAAAGLAVLAFNFFFVEPIHSFVVNDPDEWFSLLLLLVTAIVTGSLAAELRRRAEQARRREREALLLHELTGLVYADEQAERALPAVAERLRAELAAGRVEVLVDDASGPAVQPVRVGRADESDGDAFVDEPLRAGDHVLGTLRVELDGRPHGLTREEHRLVSAVAAQIGLALERARLRTAATQAEVLRRSDELKTALLSSVSHDLRTPLAAIKAAAGSVLADDGRVDGRRGPVGRPQDRGGGRPAQPDRRQPAGRLADRVGSAAPRKELYPLATSSRGSCGASGGATKTTVSPSTCRASCRRSHSTTCRSSRS